MSRTERIIIGAIGLSLALSLIFVGSRWVSVKIETGLGRDNPNSVSLMRSPSDTQIPKSDQPTSVPTEAPETSDLSPTQIPISEGAERGEDIEDVLLLYSGSNKTKFDENFCRIAEYYGLLCKKINLDLVVLTEDVFKDDQGKYFKLIGIQAENLILSRFLVSSSERDVIKLVVEQSGATLLVSELTDENFPIALVSLTNGAVQGINKPVDSTKDWMISSEAPEITQELTGSVFIRESTTNPHDFSIVFGDMEKVTTLMYSPDDLGSEYALFASVDIGSGTIFIDASQESPLIDKYALRTIYYNSEWFTRIIPLMISTRYALGDEAWHADHNYANLTLDDIWLTKNISDLDYISLLREMKSHDFHTTIGFVPARWEDSEPEVVSLFRVNSNYLSLAQHGNNADGYEFYKFEVNPRDWTAGDPEPARPLVEQIADINEGLERLDQLWARYGVSTDRVMIFPGMPPEPTLELLKAYNYLGTVNAALVPLDESRPEYWDYGMYQASLDFGNFAMLSRRSLGDPDTFQNALQDLLLDLFLGKPALIYSSPGRLFGGEMDAFSPFADDLNGLVEGIEWQSLGFILKHLYLEKVNDDGSVDVRMYANHLILDNPSTQNRYYHIFKEETLNIPIKSVTVNGYEFPYLVWDGKIQIDLEIPAGATVEIIIQYDGQASPDESVN